MKALLLAAGFGTRLEKGYQEYQGPLKDQLKNWVEGKPKGLVYIKGKPIASHIITQLEEAQIQKENIYVQTNNVYLQQFQEWAKMHHIPQENILTNGVMRNEDRLESLGDLKHALDNCIGYDDAVLVVASDTLLYNGDGSLYSLKPMLQSLNADSPIHLTGYEAHKDRLTKHGILQLGDNNQVLDFEEKPTQPKSNIAHAYVNLYSKDALNYLKNNYSFIKTFPHPLVHMHTIFLTTAHIVPKRVDIGTIEDVIEENTSSPFS